MSLRVMEVTRTVAGGYCGKLLRDAGAEVTRTSQDEERSPFWHYLHSGKATGRAAEADVLIEDVGMDLDTVEAGVTVVSLSAFGRTGPWAGRPADEFTLQAWCGSMGSRGLDAPVCAGGRLGEYAAGAYAAIAALTSGPCARVDVSMLEAMLLTQNTFGYLFPQLGAPGPSRSVELPSVEPAKDGYIGFCTVTAQQFQSFLLMIGRPDWMDDAELATAAGRRRRRTEFLQAVHAWTTQRTVAEILELAEALRIPAAPVTSPASVLEVEHFRDCFVPGHNGIRWPRMPYRPTGKAGFVDVRGVRVVDMTAFWAARRRPTCSPRSAPTSSRSSLPAVPTPCASPPPGRAPRTGGSLGRSSMARIPASAASPWICPPGVTCCAGWSRSAMCWSRTSRRGCLSSWISRRAGCSPGIPT
nr:hypothetical protein GCM10020093_006420 [Planobispora longispora]